MTSGPEAKLLALDPTFVRPGYDEASFLAIPQSIAGLLGRGPEGPLAQVLAPTLPAEYDRVLLLLADGFGWRFVEQYQRSLALRRFAGQGLVRKFTSQFPSTTAAHLTTLHTGLEVGRHGVFEWQYYEPQLDALIAPLMFSYAGTRTRDELMKDHADPKALLPQHTLYEDLASLDIHSAIFQHREYTPSTYSDIVYRGARVSPYTTFPELLTHLRAALADARGPEYVVAYFDRLDAINHHYGPRSPYSEAEIQTFLQALERQFFAKLRPAGRTLVIVTADHGAVETNPATTIYLNQDRAFNGVERFLKRNQKGALLVPGGSPRDFFLYVYEELLGEAQAFLSERLAGRAQVARVPDLIASGFFGRQAPSPTFLERVGNLVILPHARETVWWYEKDRHEQRFFGHHGGLTPQEMEIPFLALAFSGGSAGIKPSRRRSGGFPFNLLRNR